MSGILSGVMRAVRVHKFGGPEVLKVLSDVVIPRPAPGQVLVKVHAAGVNPVDTYIRAGAYKLLPELPYSPGMDVAGTVETLGDGVSNVKVGERIFGKGGCAQYVVCDSDAVYSLPDHLSYAEGACVRIPYFTAYKAIALVGQVKQGQRVLIHGASGAVGLAAVQIAKHIGAKISGTAGTEDGAKIIISTGAELTANHRQPGYESKLLEGTNGEGFSMILEVLANTNLVRDLGLIGKRGRIVVIGTRGEVSIDPRAIMVKESFVTGFSILLTAKDEIYEISKAVGKGLQEGWIKPHISKTYSMEDMGTAHEDIINSPGARGNIIVEVPH